jgi:hypothetical protein
MGLTPKGSVRIAEADRAALRTTLLETMARQYPGDTLDRMNRAYQALGLVPAGADLRSAALKLYQGQVAGFYDPHSGKLALVQGTPSMQVAQLLQHELAHALQDQHFKLQSLIDAVSHDDDQALALQAVIEGQAVVAMYSSLTGGPTDGADDPPQSREAAMAQAREALRAAGMEVSDSELESLVGGGSGGGQGGAKPSLSQLMTPAAAPEGGVPYLQAQLLFPYQEGTRFIEALMESASFPKVIARTLARPPRSTRQILHPETYGSQAPPVLVSGRHVSGLDGWHVTYETTVGELNTRTLLGGAGVGDDAAAGLVADPLVAVTGPGTGAEPCAAWITVWADGDEAEAFAAAWRRVEARRGDARGHDVYTRGGRHDVLLRRGAWVGVLAGAPAGQEAALRAALLEDLKPG